MPKRQPVLTLEFVRLNGPWRQRAAVARALAKALPVLLRAEATLPPGAYTISVALTDDAHQKDLNHQFRGIARATNVLSFPQYGKRALQRLPPAPPRAAPRHLGDISLAYQYIAAEAARDGKPLTHHIIHLVIHGILHILGHDHQTARQAALMEQLERDILSTMKIADPYAPAAKQSRAAPRNPRKA